MGEKEKIIESMATFFKENSYRTDSWVSMYNAWSLNTGMTISNSNVPFAIKTIKELMDVR